jgi:hypothetical protein
MAARSLADGGEIAQGSIHDRDIIRCAYLASYYFGKGGRQTERRFNAVSDEIKVCANGSRRPLNRSPEKSSTSVASASNGRIDSPSGLNCAMT